MGMTSADPLTVVLDGTPLLGRRTGIGRYTASLLAALGEMTLAGESTVDIGVSGFTMRGWRSMRSLLPPGTRATGPPLPARALRACWSRVPFPPVELLCGKMDVMHATNFVLPPSLRAAGVVTVHDLDFLFAPGELPPQERNLPELVRQSVRRAKAICTPTAAVGDLVSERFSVPRSKIVVTPLGIDAEWLHASPAGQVLQARHGLPDEYMVFVGEDRPRKGLAGLLSALDDDLPPLVIAGPGDSSRDGRVLRTGYLAEADLRSVVAGARALVLPSRDEGFGLPALEALACGVPVVCSDLPALREVTAGFAALAPFGDRAALHAALHAALALPRTDAADAARRAHAASFTWRGCAEATLRAYQLATG